MVEGRSRYDLQSQFWHPQKSPKKSPFWGHFRECRNRDMWEIIRSQKVELARLVCHQRACSIMQIMVKPWPEMVEASSRYDPPKSILVPPEKTKKSPFWGHFLDCRNRDMWEITRSQKVELARPVCLQRVCYMMQIMVKQRPEMVEGSSRYDPPKSILVLPEKNKKSAFWVIFGTVGTVICGRLQEARKSSQPGQYAFREPVP